MANSLFDSLEVARSNSDSILIQNENALLTRGPLAFTLMLSSVVGTVVNMLITIVFLKRFPASAIRSFIVTMSVSDFVATGFAIPLHLFTLFMSYNFPSPIACKVFFTVQSLSTNCSSFVIVLFAVDRLRRIRKPVFKELDTVRSYYQVGVVVTLAVVVTVPFVPMYGIYSIPTRFGDLKLCWVDDTYANTLYPIVYQAVLSVTFVVGLSLIMYSYSMIGISIHELARDMQAELERKHLQPHPVDIYIEEPVPSVSKVDVQMVPIVGVLKAEEASPPRLTFAERLHGPRNDAGLYSLTVDVAERGGQRPSKIKKISTAIQQFFTPAPQPSESSETTSCSSFVSQRMDGSFAKTMTGLPLTVSEVGSHGTAKPPAVPKPATHRLSSSSSHSSSLTDFKKITAAAIPLDRNQSADSDPVLGNKGGGRKVVLLQEQAQTSAAKTEGTTKTTTPYQTTESMVTGPPATSGERPADKVTPAEGQTVRVSHHRQKVSATHRRSRAEADSLDTLDHLYYIKRKATHTMIVLTLLYVVTWLPNLLSRSVIPLVYL